MSLIQTMRMVWTHPMSARNGRVAALSRFARWQIASRLLGARTALPYVEDSVLLADSGITAATGNYYYGLIEPEEMGFVLHALRPDDLFVDIGANIGSYTVLAAKVVGATTISAEPVPATFARLTQNVALNGVADRTRLVAAIISDKPGRIRMSIGLDAMNHVLAEGEQLPSEEIAATTLDALCGDRSPALMKIDVEGHEKSVLLGGAQTLASPALQAVVMETNGSGERFGVADDELFEIMAGHGFQPHQYDPFARRVVPARHQANTVFLRDADWANARCAAAPRFRITGGSI